MKAIHRRRRSTGNEARDGWARAWALTRVRRGHGVMVYPAASLCWRARSAVFGHSTRSNGYMYLKQRLSVEQRRRNVRGQRRTRVAEPVAWRARRNPTPGAEGTGQ